MSTSLFTRGMIRGLPATVLLLTAPAAAWAAEEGPVIDTGDTTFILISAALVMLMVPGVALLYVLAKGLSSTLEGQADILEKEMNTFRLPLPTRPPKSVNLLSHGEVIDDEFIFRDVFFGIQGFLELHARVIRSITTNDQFRKTIIEMAIEELRLFDKLVKFGKLKGWLKAPPMYVQ